MAHPPHTARQPAAHELDRPPDLADGLSSEAAPGADEVHAAAVPVAVSYPEWRREELARKYGDEPYEERYERGFYHPYG